MVLLLDTNRKFRVSSVMISLKLQSCLIAFKFNLLFADGLLRYAF